MNFHALEALYWCLLPFIMVFNWHWLPWLHAVKDSLQKEKHAKPMRFVFFPSVLFWPVGIIVYVIGLTTQGNWFYGIFLFIAGMASLVSFPRFLKFWRDDDTFNKWKKKIRNYFKVHQVAPIKGR